MISYTNCGFIVTFFNVKLIKIFINVFEIVALVGQRTDN